MYCLLQCPVCTLFLHIGMSLEEHLETHPKDQVIKALVQTVLRPPPPDNTIQTLNTQNASTSLSAPQSSNASYGTIQKITAAPQPTNTPQTKVIIVNSTSTSTKFYHRTNPLLVNNLQQSNSHAPENSDNQLESLEYPSIDENHKSSENIPDCIEENLTCNQTNNDEDDSLRNATKLKEEEGEEEEPEEIADEEEEVDEQQQQQQQQLHLEQQDDNLECDENSITSEIENKVAAQYYERENGDFVLEECPKSVVEYSENEEGDLLLNERIVKTPLSVIHFSDDDGGIPNENDDCKEIDMTIEPEKIFSCIPKIECINENANMDNCKDYIIDRQIKKEEDSLNFKCYTRTPGLKVLSNVKLTPDMLSSGIKEIIISAKSATKSDAQTEISSFNHNLLSTIKHENIDEIEYPTRPKSVIQTPLNNYTTCQSTSKTSIILQEPQNLSSRNNNNDNCDINSDCSVSSSVIKMASMESIDDGECYSSKDFKQPNFNSYKLRPRGVFCYKPPKKLILKPKRNNNDDDGDCDNPEDLTTTSTSVKTSYELSENEIDIQQNLHYVKTINSDDDYDNTAESSNSLSNHHLQRIRKKTLIRKKPIFRSMWKSGRCLKYPKFIRDKRNNRKKRLKLNDHDNNNDDDADNDDDNEIPCNSNTIASSLCKLKLTKSETNYENDIIEQSVNDDDHHFIRPKIEITTNDLPNAEIKIEPWTTSHQVVTSSASSSSSSSAAVALSKNDIKLESWTSQITSAIKTMDSHHSDDLPCGLSLLPSNINSTENSRKNLINNTNNNDLWNEEIVTETISFGNTDSEHKPIINNDNQFNDINQAGPSGIDYRIQNNFFNNFESDFVFPSNDKSNHHHNNSNNNNLNNNNTNRFGELNEDAHTQSGWRQSFTIQYVNCEGDRNSYMDLDACKANSTCIRAPSTESLNIRTDEKMPARGEISEQESNGEIDISWHNNQAYPYYHQDSIPKFQTAYDLSKESWKPTPESILSFSENIPKFTISTDIESSILNVKPLNACNNNDGGVKIECKKEKAPRSYKCNLCYEKFPRLKLKRAHMELSHPNHQQNIIEKPVATTTATATAILSSVVKNEMNQQIDTKIFFSSTITHPQEGTSSLYGNDIDVKPLANDFIKGELNNDTKNIPNIVMGYDELKNELLVSFNQDEDLKLNLASKVRKKKIYICNQCKQEFTSIKAFDIHLAIHPAECQECGKLFRHWTNLSIHLKRHLGIKNYMCRCGKRFVLKQKLHEHMRIHTGVAPISCSICPQKFRRYSNLIQHRNRHHLNIKPEQKDYVCHCGDVFHTKAKFAWHKEIHEKKPKGCPYCRERFIHQNSLTRHIRLSHSERYWFYKNQAVECPICKQLYLKSSIKHHIKTHNVKTEFKCSICNKAFSTKWNLKQHRWIHACRTTKPYKCKICTAAFVRETDYITHMNIHKSLKPYTCDHCGRQFSRKYNWLRHTREHETPKKFKCNICNKAFHRAYYLTEHTRVHSGERPFTCNICGKTSATKTNHNKHIVIHHARDPLTAEG